MKKILLSLVAIIMGGFLAVSPLISAPAYAEDNKDKCEPVKTTFFGEIQCDDKDGKGIKDVLGFVVDTMSIGVGVLGVIGITVVGIQYLTAGGNEEKTRKAKRRLLEIVIGIVVYVLLSAILKFLGVA